MQHHVFLSYSHKDIDIMQRIRQDLAAAGLHVWTDETLTPGTESWKNAIEEALQNTGSLVVILSPDSKHSVWVEREMDYAQACGVTIFPVLARGDSEVSAIPFQLINVQRADIRTQYDTGMAQLIAGLRKHLKLSTDDVEIMAHTPRHAVPHTPTMAEQIDKLDPWNFFDQARLLWWLLAEPATLLKYIQSQGDTSVRQTGAWLVSSMVWVTLLAPTVGYALNTVTMPGTQASSRLFVVIGGAILLLQGFIISRLGSSRDNLAGVILLIIAIVLSLTTFVAISSVSGVIFTRGGGLTGLGFLVTTGVMFGIGSGIAFRVANPTTGGLAGIVIAAFIFNTLFNIPFGVEGGIAGVVMAGLALLVGTVIQHHLRTGQRSWLGLILFGLLIANFAVMMWLYFLGGWQILAAA